MYRSLFLGDRNPHQLYYGWVLAEDRPGLRVLTKRRGVVTRTLMLLSAGGAEAAEAVVRNAAGPLGWSDIVVHDFAGVLGGEPCLGGLRFRRAADAERLLNVATFVVDLAPDEPTLLAAMHPDYRRKIRKAEQSGLRVVIHDRPGPELQRRFVAAFAGMAAERSLAAVDPAVLSRMYADGNAFLLVAERATEVTNYLHIYLAGDTGLFMYGVNPQRENDGAGQYLQWQAMRELKRRGFGWYDLGGVASLDPSHGIFNFKQKFGGELVQLGTEWRHVGRSLGPVLAVYGMARSLQRTVLTR